MRHPREKAPGQPQRGLLSKSGWGGGLWAGRALALSKGPGWRTPLHPQNPLPQGLQAPPPEPGSGTHLGRVTHTPYFRGDGEQVGV